MKLSDLRRFCIKQQVRIRFPVEGNMECVITEHGLCQVPTLNAPPGFRLDDKFTKAEFFIVETPHTGDRTAARKLDRTQLESLTAAGDTAIPVDHDE